MSGSKFKFSKASIDKLVNTTGKREQYYDTVQHGLCIRTTPNNTKTFRFYVWDKLRKKPVQETIGKYPHISVNTAREIVANRLIDISRGINIIQRNKEAREEQTLSEVFETWINDHAKGSKKTWQEDLRRYDLYVADHIGKMSLSAITPVVIRHWRDKITKQKKLRGEGYISKTTINRAFSIISTVFNCCAPHMQNPCSTVTKYKEKKLNTFLKSNELQRFFVALDSPATPDYLKDYLLLSLYTGARRSNVLAMRWNHIDLNINLWMIPGDEMKNTQPMVIPLLDQAAVILQRRKKTVSSIFVFPTPRRSKTGHLVEPKKSWKSLLKRASLPETYRLHDLRRTMGSWQAITGSSTKIIGASLGHKSEQATSHYAHLTIEPVRTAMQRAADAMDEQKDVEKVVNLNCKT